MRKLALAAVIALSAMGAGATAKAMPALQVGPTPDPIVKVEGGCGPGAHRNGYGRCVGDYRRPYRACPPGMHLDRFGHCRRNF